MKDWVDTSLIGRAVFINSPKYSIKNLSDLIQVCVFIHLHNTPRQCFFEGWGMCLCYYRRTKHTLFKLSPQGSVSLIKFEESQIVSTRRPFSRELTYIWRSTKFVNDKPLPQSIILTHRTKCVVYHTYPRNRFTRSIFKKIQ